MYLMFTFLLSLYTTLIELERHNNNNITLNPRAIIPGTCVLNHGAASRLTYNTGYRHHIQYESSTDHKLQ